MVLFSRVSSKHVPLDKTYHGAPCHLNFSAPPSRRPQHANMTARTMQAAPDPVSLFTLIFYKYPWTCPIAYTAGIMENNQGVLSEQTAISRK